LIVPDPSNPQAFNRFSYVISNPINLTDPSGHCYIGGYSVWIPNGQDGPCSWESGSNTNDDAGGGSSSGSSGNSSSRGNGETDTDGDGVPNIPKPHLIIPPMGNGICAHDTLTECLYAGQYLPTGDFHVSDEDWNA